VTPWRRASDGVYSADSERRLQTTGHDEPGGARHPSGHGTALSPRRPTRHQRLGKERCRGARNQPRSVNTFAGRRDHVIDPAESAPTPRASNLIAPAPGSGLTGTQLCRGERGAEVVVARVNLNLRLPKRERALSSSRRSTACEHSQSSIGAFCSRPKPVAPQTFDRILRNPIYVGRIVVKGWNVDIRGDFEALVPEAVYERVLARLRSGKGASRRKAIRADFPLRRFVRCAFCDTKLTGSRLTGRAGRRYGYYHCPDCAKVKLPKAVLEERFLDLLNSLWPKPSFIRVFHETVLDVRKRELSAAENTRRQLETRIAPMQASSHRSRDSTPRPRGAALLQTSRCETRGLLGDSRRPGRPPATWRL
jgi:Recombinase